MVTKSKFGAAFGGAAFVTVGSVVTARNAGSSMDRLCVDEGELRSSSIYDDLEPSGRAATDATGRSIICHEEQSLGRR